MRQPTNEAILAPNFVVHQQTKGLSNKGTDCVNAAIVLILRTLLPWKKEYSLTNWST